MKSDRAVNCPISRVKLGGKKKEFPQDWSSVFMVGSGCVEKGRSLVCEVF